MFWNIFEVSSVALKKNRYEFQTLGRKENHAV